MFSQGRGASLGTVRVLRLPAVPMSPEAAADWIPPDVLHQHGLVLLGAEGDVLRVGAAAPPPPLLLRDLAFMTGKTIEPVELSPDALAARLDEKARRDEKARLGEGGRAVPASAAGRATPPRAAPGRGAVVPQGPVVQQVDRLIQRAIEQEASDIHIEPYEAFFRVRYRLDGVLHAADELSLLQRDALISRLKIMAALDIAERRRPQDGRIRYPLAGRTIDLRVSTLPTDFGEKVVLRILDKRRLRLDLDALGFDAEALKTFRRAIHQPYGILLVSGPTGSGKTTTLYAALNEINTEAVNITTIEDPIEYNLPGINQTHVRADIGLTFAHALRAFLRQDPNIIMVGEIRDRETAEIAIRAALTGHLVLSTIHTNDAVTTVTRLADMGVEPFLVASSLRLAVAQRLVRRICPDCKEAWQPEPSVRDAFVRDAVHIFYRGRGCDACNGTGYRGRTALFEVVPISERLAGLIAQRATAYELRRQARADGARGLRQAAIERMRTGDTTAAEVLRETSL
ncbi:MAG: GspE/PulE family protein [Rhodothermales bacterium]|nr:GspE/PulE family protein [Rhodothermales bacterium]